MYQLVRGNVSSYASYVSTGAHPRTKWYIVFIFNSGKYIIRIKHYQLTEYQYIISSVYTPLISSLYSIDITFILHSYHFYTWNKV